MRVTGNALPAQPPARRPSTNDRVAAAAAQAGQAAQAPQAAPLPVSGPPADLAGATAIFRGTAAKVASLAAPGAGALPSATPPAPGGAASLLGGVGGPSPRDLARFEEVAKGFETSVFSTLLKQMRDALQPDTLFPGDSADVLGGMFDMFLGQHLAQAGSLGITDAIKKQLLQRYEASTPPVGDPRRSGLSGQAVPPTPGAGTGGA